LRAAHTSHLLRRTPQISRMNLDLRELREYIRGEEAGSQATLPKYEVGAPPPAYFKG
jgi:hypothetical protein